MPLSVSAGSVNGRIPEWPNGADCKSAVLRLRWFESIFAHKTVAGVAQLIEHQPSKLRVAGLSPVSRSKCQCSSVVEHFLGKEEVTGSSPVIGSKWNQRKTFILKNNYYG